MSASYLAINAWREMLARLFDATIVEFNVSPEWLINPATRRRLKLDYLYPEVGIAVRITGLTAKGQRRRSDWESMEDEQRDQTREEMCRANGIQLIVIDPFEEPAKSMDKVLRILSRSSRLLAEGDETKKRKQRGMDVLGKAHQRATTLHGRLLRTPDQTIATLAESWRDREAGLATELQNASQLAQVTPSPVALKVISALQTGQKVRHTAFGEGVVTDVQGEGPEAQITILFDGERERMFLLKLITDKLQVLS